VTISCKKGKGHKNSMKVSKKNRGEIEGSMKIVDCATLYAWIGGDRPTWGGDTQLDADVRQTCDRSGGEK